MLIRVGRSVDGGYSDGEDTAAKTSARHTPPRHARRRAQRARALQLLALNKTARLSSTNPSATLIQNNLSLPSRKNHSQAPTHSHSPRILIHNNDELLSAGPGYIEYSGPAPLGDQGVVPNSQGVLTYARLRDACPCPRCIHPSTRQKTHTSGEALREVAELGSEPLPETKLHAATGPDGESGVEVHWPLLDGQPHSSFYSTDLIRRLTSGRVRGQTFLQDVVKRRFWTRESLVADAGDALWTDYSQLHAGAPGAPLDARPEVLLRVLRQLQTYGLAIIRGLPTDKTGNKDCSLRELAESIGLIRNTFYGETWDVKSVVNSKNVAYTNLNLGLHMDLLYFALPPRFQLLHALRNRVVGGASYFVDSFAAAAAFQARSPELYSALQRNSVEYEYDNDGHYLAFQHPVLPSRPLHDPHLHTVINWSPPFQAPPVQRATDAQGRATPAAETEFYTALSEFQAALDDPQYRFEFTMAEGDVALFDNQRVLHARTAFRDKTAEELQRDGTVLVPGEPTRWLKGLYLDGSTVWDRLAVLGDRFGR